MDFQSCRRAAPVALVSFCVGALLLFAPGCGMCVSVQPGWPQATGGWVSGSPALGDLDGDGDLEVVIGSSSEDGNVHAWHHDGTTVTGWPQNTGDAVDGSPVLADLDGDGDLEVVIGLAHGGVCAWHHDGTVVAGWPQATDHGVPGSPAVGDLDGDGDLEVVAGSLCAGEQVGVYAWHHDGTVVAGWPRTIFVGVEGSPALGDLDKDGDLEIVVAGSAYYVYAWHHDGTPVSGWPRFTSWTFIGSSPALGDLDGDGYLEVVVGADDGEVYAWDYCGGTLTGWPQEAGGNAVHASPALGDVDRDGNLEVVAGSYDWMYAWRYDGTVVTGWPVGMVSVLSSPALADLDGDGNLEIVVGDNDAKVYAWHWDGTAVAGWPMAAGTLAITCSSPVVADLDDDGDVEVVIGSLDGLVYAWSCDLPTEDCLAWPMFHHDGLRTGMHHPKADFRGDPICGSAPLSVVFSDLSSDSPTSWTWDFGDGGTATERNSGHTYTSPGRYTVSLTAANCGGSGAEVKENYVAVNFTDIPPGHWAFSQILACYEADIVGGYEDGTYRPELPVTRDAIAVYLARALAGGDAGVPPGPDTATFSDVPTDYWAYKYVEYLAPICVVRGYWDGTYRPTLTVDRAQMAVFVCRAMVAHELGDACEEIPDPGCVTPPFPDVPCDQWARKYIAYCRDHGVVGGYWDGTYRPEEIVNRGAMAVYVQRAFDLPT